MIQTFTAKVSQLTKLTKDIFEITLDLIQPSEMDFLPGQYVSVRIPNAENKIMYRAYSIASASSRKNQIDLCIKCVSQGLGSWHLKNLTVGDEVTMRGPMGEFVLKEDSQRDIVLIGAGTGVAPLKSMLFRLLELRDQRQIKLYFGMRTKDDWFYDKELLNLAVKNRNLSLVLTMSRENSADSPYHIGRITNHLEKDIQNVANLEAYICGGMEFITDVEEVLLRKGLGMEHIYYEKFY